MAGRRVEPLGPCRLRRGSPCSSSCSHPSLLGRLKQQDSRRLWFLNPKPPCTCMYIIAYAHVCVYMQTHCIVPSAPTHTKPCFLSFMKDRFPQVRLPTLACCFTCSRKTLRSVASQGHRLRGEAHGSVSGGLSPSVTSAFKPRGSQPSSLSNFLACQTKHSALLPSQVPRCEGGKER